MNQLDEIAQDFVAECQVDYEGLWSLVWRLRQALPDRSPEEYRRLTVDLLERLLSEGEICIGDLSIQDGFQRWQETPQEAIARIQLEWDSLGSEPRLGDIAWFTAAEATR